MTMGEIKTWIESTKELQDAITTGVSFSDTVIKIETEEEKQK